MLGKALIQDAVVTLRLEVIALHGVGELLGRVLVAFAGVDGNQFIGQSRLLEEQRDFGGVG